MLPVGLAWVDVMIVVDKWIWGSLLGLSTVVVAPEDSTSFISLPPRRLAEYMAARNAQITPKINSCSTMRRTRGFCIDRKYEPCRRRLWLGGRPYCQELAMSLGSNPSKAHITEGKSHGESYSVLTLHILDGIWDDARAIALLDISLCLWKIYFFLTSRED